MNWKNVLYLLRVERKSGRLVRGAKMTRYRENNFFAYWPYWLAAILGIVGGLIANWAVSEIVADPTALPGFNVQTAALGFFVSMPTLILMLSLVFTMFQQIQLAGIKKTAQIMYWLPVTWQEHTVASILSNLFGLPIALVVGFASGLIVFAAFNGFLLVGAALLTTLAMCGAAIIGSSTTEIAIVLISRFTGAVYKSSGRAAIWVRLIATLAIIAIGYSIYFTVVLGNGSVIFIQGIQSTQNLLWFFPYVWPGLALSNIFSSQVLAIGFIAGSVLFMAALYYLAIKMNQRFGLYEPPAITLQTKGAYTPKTGLLGKVGFSTAEAAIIRKDIRSFTRRKELISIFIVPVIFTILAVFNSMNLSQSGVSGGDFIFVPMLFLFPSSLMAMTLGNMLIGEEGHAVWRIYASPITAENFVKSKFAFLVLLSTAVVIVTGIIGVLLFNPSTKVTVVAVVEAMFLVFAIGSIALTMGFKGADFTMVRRARMIRQEWALISLVACGLAALAVLAPLIPYALSAFIGFTLVSTQNLTDFILPLAISGVIAAVISAVFYKINIDSAKELFRKAEN
jgi:hypothetical protein